MTRRLCAGLVVALAGCSLAVASPGAAQDTATVAVGDRLRIQMTSGVSLDGSLLQLHEGFLELQTRKEGQVKVPLADLEDLAVFRGYRRRFGVGKSILYGVIAGATVTTVFIVRSYERDAGLAYYIPVALGVPAGIVFSGLVWMARWEGVPLPLDPRGTAGPLQGTRLSLSIPIG